jgi:hypothetical protein
MLRGRWEWVTSSRLWVWFGMGMDRNRGCTLTDEDDELDCCTYV